MATIEGYRQEKLTQLRRSDGTIPTAGELLYKYRTRADLSQGRIARIIGVHESTIGRIEIGTRALPRKISFYDNLRHVERVSESEVIDLLFTDGAPRWLEPEDESEVKNNAQRFST